MLQVFFLVILKLVLRVQATGKSCAKVFFEISQADTSSLKTLPKSLRFDTLNTEQFKLSLNKTITVTVYIVHAYFLY